MTLRRSSSQYQLDQVFKLDKKEKDVTITMTLTNISGAMIPDVRITRAYDPDINNDFGDDLEVRSARGVCTRPDPVLDFCRAGDQAVVSWQGSLTGFRLQSSTNVSLTSSWSDVSNSPVLVQGRNMVTNRISGAQRFYRLLK